MRKKSAPVLSLEFQFCSILAGLCFGIMTAGTAAAQTKFTSNTQTVLDATLLDVSGEDIGLYAVAHVRTKVNLSTGGVDFHVNIRQESAIAYVSTEQTSNNPKFQRLSELKLKIDDLKAQIIAIQGQLKAAQAELEEVLDTDINPILPGRQIDTDRARALQALLGELAAQLKQLQVRLREAYQEIQSLIEDLQEQAEEPEEEISTYELGGAINTSSPDCFSAERFCKFVAPFSLVHANSTVSVVFLRFGLQFTERGSLESAIVDLACETPCGVGEEDCLCF